MSGWELCTFWMLAAMSTVELKASATEGFARTNGTKFVVGQKPLFVNGFNAYWLMYMASYPPFAGNVTSAFEQASKHGMNVARAWAFNDGGDRPLQISPGNYSEDMFKAMDFVVSEAKRYGVYLILSLVNNYADFGGRKQYVEWAQAHGRPVSNEDDFYTDLEIRGYYKNHVKAVLTRNNTITGIAYRDDPAIFAWELINEPRCARDLSGNTVQTWAAEMAAYAKSIDGNHLVEIGLEGFYGLKEKQLNPNNYVFGTDFISDNQIAAVDFTTMHAYPDLWFDAATDNYQLNFINDWSTSHIQFTDRDIKKPLVLSEFGKSSKEAGFSESKRDAVFTAAYDIIYRSAVNGGPFGGAIFWQLLQQGMDSLRDGYEVILDESPSTAAIIIQQSHRLSQLS